MRAARDKLYDRLVTNKQLINLDRMISKREEEVRDAREEMDNRIKKVRRKYLIDGATKAVVDELREIVELANRE